MPNSAGTAKDGGKAKPMEEEVKKFNELKQKSNGKMFEGQRKGCTEGIWQC